MKIAINKNMYNLKKVLFFLIILFGLVFNFTYAEDIITVDLIIRDGSTIIFENSVPLQPAGTIELNGHPLLANSVLAVLNDADLASDDFSITDLQYYDSFGSFYVKCINSQCDNWQYVVDDTSPGIGMDQKILSGGEEIYVYFSQQHKIILSSNSITTEENVTVNSQNYVYRNDSWEPLTGVTVGITETNPDDPFSPIEIQTLAVDDASQANFSNLAVGSYNVGIKEDFYFPTEALNVTEAVHSSSGGGSKVKVEKVEITEKEPVFNIEKAFEYLISQQKEDGGFGKELYTDWATLALMSTEKYQEAKIKLIKYYSSNNPRGNLLTDYQRHAMALMSLGINPYNTNGENYIKKITDSFDEKQFGNIEEDNDDIFAILVLKNSGFKEEELLKKSLAFILLRQKENGSWDGSIDMTGAGIVALSPFQDIKEVKIALEKAREYLVVNQKEDGGFGNVSSTAWAMQGILSLGEKTEDWKKNENSPIDYFSKNQAEDGGTKNEDQNSKLWETAYILASLSGKNWQELLQDFEKPKEELLPVVSNPLIERINNSRPTTFSKKIQQFQKPAELEKIVPIQIENTVPTPVKKQNWFRKFLDIILNF